TCQTNSFDLRLHLLKTYCEGVKHGIKRALPNSRRGCPGDATYLCGNPQAKRSSAGRRTGMPQYCRADPCPGRKASGSGATAHSNLVISPARERLRTADDVGNTFAVEERPDYTIAGHISGSGLQESESSLSESQNPQHRKYGIPVPCCGRHTEEFIDATKIPDRLHMATIQSKYKPIFRPDDSYKPLPIFGN